MMHSVDILFGMWKQSNTGERFGQWFINRFVKVEDSTTNSMWEADQHKAYQMILYWCEDNNYSYNLPPFVRKDVDNKLVSV